jgi:hypothetical protein
MTTSTALRILGRVFGVVACVSLACTFIGLVVGAFFGAVCAGLLWKLSGSSSIGGLLEHVQYGAAFGGLAGVYAGGGSGFIAGIVVAVVQRASARMSGFIKRTLWGALCGSFLGALAGAINGSLVYLLCSYLPALNVLDLQSEDVFDMFGGFSIGSVAGFVLGLLIGAIRLGSKA